MTMPNDTPAGDESLTGGARTQIREVKEQVVDQAKSSFRQARDSAATSLNDSRHQAADRIGGIATAVRSTSEHLRSENQPRVADLTDSLAGQVERLSSYLRDQDLRAFRNDVESFARRQPAVAVGVALALGVLGARFLKSSQRSGSGTSSRRSFGDEGLDRFDYESERSGGYRTGAGPAGGYGISSQPAGGGYGGA